MDPVAPTTPNQMPPQPPAPQSPQPPAPQSPQPQQQSGYPYPNSSQGPKSHSGGKIALIIGAVIGVLVLILGVLVALYIFYFSPAAVSKRTSNKFMGYISTNNVEGALTLSVSNDAETKKFLEDAATKLNGTYNLKQSGSKNSKYYFLYNISSSSGYTSARTEITQQNGKWLVGSLVYNKGNVALIPGEDVPITENSAGTPAPATTSSACLVQSDFDSWYAAGTGLGKTATSYGFDFSKPDSAYSTNVKFEADSVNYTDPQINKSFVEDIANLAKAVKDKTFTIRLYGSVATTATQDLDFATKRANKVKADLVAFGVPAEKISVEAPTNINAVSDPEFRNEITKAGARGVYIKFDPTCSSSSSGR